MRSPSDAVACGPSFPANPKGTTRRTVLQAATLRARPHTSAIFTPRFIDVFILKLGVTVPVPAQEQGLPQVRPMRPGLLRQPEPGEWLQQP